MSSTLPGRRLAAIVFTDIVGYSAIVHGDEALGARLLDRQRTVVRGLVPAYGGREVETAGDSFLLEFDSALAAVQCVVAIQNKLAADASGPRVVLRASVHLGDIEHRGREVFGDGVNVSARLLPLSPEGGMAMSAPVLAMVRQRVQLPAKSIGTPALKNITSPVEVFVVEPAELAALTLPEAVAPVAAALRPHARRVLIGLAAVLVMTLIAVFAWRGSSRVPADLDDKSIAVLPFTNMSDDKSNAYFADGMQDEILTALAQIKALKVISRTSVEQYRDKQHDLPSIARALNVATVLEGGVQRSGNRVRINVQLIDARNDKHLWAESYDGDVADLFTVQSDVARRVAQSLQAALLPAERERLDSVPTQNAKAYDLFLQARQLQRQMSESVEALTATLGPKAIDLYEQAVAEDPAFAVAFASLSTARLSLYWFGADKDPALLASARQAAEHALSLSPGLGQAHVALGVWHYWGYRDYAAAESELERARESLPNNALLERFLGAVHRRRGEWEAGLRGFQRAAELDPQAAANWLEIGNTHYLMGRYDEAELAYRRAQTVATDPTQLAAPIGWLRFGAAGDLGSIRSFLSGLAQSPAKIRERHADFYYANWFARDYAAALKALDENPSKWASNFSSDIYLPKALLAGQAHQALGDAAAARRAFEESQQLLEAELKVRPNEAALHSALGLTLAGLGQKAEAVRAARHAVELLPPAKDALVGAVYIVYLAETYALTGDGERALQTLERLEPYGMGWIASPGVLKTDPAWDSVRSDPRFQALIRKHDSGT